MAKEIDYAMPVMCKGISGCAYSPESRTMGFRMDDYSVVIQDRKMMIINADSEEKAQTVMDRLAAIYEKAQNEKEQTGK